MHGQGLQPVGLFGGSFDPPHMGHVALVHAALDLLQLPELWVVPVGLPVHRELSGRADGARRLAWMRRIFSDEPYVVVQDWEVRALEPTPTIDTLRRIRREMPHLRPVLLLGSDAFAGIESWIGYPDHIELCDVAVFSRAGEPPLASHHGWQPVKIDAWRSSAGSGRLLQVAPTLPEISATELRDRAVAGKSLAKWVPECVRQDVERAYTGS